MSPYSTSSPPSVKVLAIHVAPLAATLIQMAISRGTATAHLFIQNAVAGGGLLRLFSTHPPTTARVERLEAMALRGVAAAV